MNIISWYKWYQHKDEDNQLLAKSKKLSFLQSILVYVIIGIVSVIVHFCISEVAGDTWMRFAGEFSLNVIFMQWLDSIIFAIGIIAIGLEALRYKEQYVLWLITDVFAVVQYALKKDPVYITKKAIYLVMAIVGLINWHNLSKKNIINE